MKFSQLPLGARFRYGGQTWSKSGPLAASGPGGQRMMARSALVEPLEPTATEDAIPAAPPALDRYHRTARRLIETAAQEGSNALPGLLDALEVARHDALLGLAEQRPD